MLCDPGLCGLAAAAKGRARQAEATTECAITLVFCVENAATLQLRNRPFEGFERRPGHERRHDVPAVAATTLEPVLHDVGDAGRRADSHVIPCAPAMIL